MNNIDNKIEDEMKACIEKKSYENSKSSNKKSKTLFQRLFSKKVEDDDRDEHVNSL